MTVVSSPGRSRRRIASIWMIPVCFLAIAITIGSANTAETAPEGASGSAPVVAAESAADKPLVIEEEAPEGIASFPSGSVAQEIPVVAPPALDLFDPAHPDPTYIPPNKRFGVSETGSSLPARLDVPGTDMTIPSGLSDLLASGTEEKPRTASPSSPADRAAWPMLSPGLIRGADFAAAQQAAAEEAPATTLEGKLIREDQPLGRRSFFRRWAIQTAKGERFPLTSNIPLMLAVKQKGVLDARVSITGRWNQAKGEKRLKFFTADTVRPLETPAAISGKDAHGKKNLAGSVMPASGTTDASLALPTQGFLSGPLGSITASEAKIIPPPPAH